MSEKKRQITLERLKQEIAIGLQDLETGRFREIPSEREHLAFIAEIRAKAMRHQILED